MAIWKATYGGDERTLKVLGDQTVETKLVKDDSGAWYYESELSSFRVSGEDFKFYADLAELENFSCQDIELDVYVNCGNNQRQYLYRGVFTASSIAFNYEQCTAEIKPKTRSIYKCLLDNWDEDQNILQAPNPVTIGEFDALYEFGTIQWTPEFIVTDGDPANDPTEPGYHPDRVVSIGGYEIWYRYFYTVDCSAGVPPVVAFWLTAIDNCGLNGTAKIVSDGNAFNNFDDTPTVPYQFQNTDFQVFGDVISATNFVSLSPQRRIISNPVDGNFIVFAPSGESVNEYSNGRRLEDVINYLLEQSCGENISVKSDLFQFQSTEENVLSSQGLDKALYNGAVVFQTTDVIFADADEDATRGIMTLKDLLGELNNSMRVFWRLEEEGDQLFLRIEHESFFAIQGSQDYKEEYKGWYKTESKNDEFPKRETYTALSQYSIDFVGMDVKYQGNCVGSEQKSNTSRLFIYDYPYLVSAYDVEPPLDSFVLVCTQNYQQGDFIQIGEGEISDNFIPNSYLSWSFLHRYLHKHERPVPNMNVNGENVTALSLAPNKTTLFKTCFSCNQLIDYYKDVEIRNGKYMRITNVIHDLRQNRLEVQGELR